MSHVAHPSTDVPSSSRSDIGGKLPAIAGSVAVLVGLAVFVPGWAGIRSSNATIWFNATKSYVPEGWLLFGIGVVALISLWLVRGRSSRPLAFVSLLATCAVIGSAIVRGPTRLIDPEVVLGLGIGEFTFVRGPLLYLAGAAAALAAVFTVLDARSAGSRHAPEAGRDS